MPPDTVLRSRLISSGGPLLGDLADTLSNTEMGTAAVSCFTNDTIWDRQTPELAFLSRQPSLNHILWNQKPGCEDCRGGKIGLYSSKSQCQKKMLCLSRWKWLQRQGNGRWLMDPAQPGSAKEEAEGNIGMSWRHEGTDDGLEVDIGWQRKQELCTTGKETLRGSFRK